ncbi:MAG: hypothetical protein Q8942_19675, partial [Bacillota bacterium]|nr:hypothetical protein [Bacillota bacterium]
KICCHGLTEYLIYANPRKIAKWSVDKTWLYSIISIHIRFDAYFYITLGSIRKNLATSRFKNLI